MTGTMHIIFSQTRDLQRIARQGVSGNTGDAGAQARLAGLHRVENGIVDRAHTVFGRLSQTDSAGHISAVAMITRTHIYGNEFAALDAAATWLRVRHRAIGTRSNDRLERQAIGSLLDHETQNLPLDLFFGHAGLNPVTDMRKRRIRNRDCPLEQVYFIWLLNPTQSIYVARLDRYKLVDSFGLSVQPLIIRIGDCICLEADLFPAILLRLRCHSWRVLTRNRNDDLPAACLFPGHFGVQRIGEQELLLLPHQQRPIWPEGLP